MENLKQFHYYPAAKTSMMTHWPVQKINLLRAFQEKLFSGQVVNYSENLAAWHTEYRNPNPVTEVTSSLKNMKLLSDQIRYQKNQLLITDVVHIGIGGSDLGPKLICEAFADEIDGPSIHFVSNLDAIQIQLLLKKLTAKNTLFIVVSKSFRTIETIENMCIAKTWLKDHGCDVMKHLFAVTHHQTLAIQEYHFLPSNVLLMPEWIGGRFSIWSSVGLICAIAFGFERFYMLHQGAHVMDQHFRHIDLQENMPIQYATILYDALINQKISTLGIFPYAYRLRTLPLYLQQLIMESLGKSVDVNNNLIPYPTGPIVFGGEGTNVQHSVQQLMMQGTQSFMADFILPLRQRDVNERIQAMMVANCMTQVKTLRDGALNAHQLQSISGGKLVNLFVLDSLDFFTLGLLIGFYEHAVTSLGFLFNINSFDQWGVESAKRQSNRCFEQMKERLLDRSEIEKLLASMN